MESTVCHIDVGRGFGFIRAEVGKDLFFHVLDLAPGLEFNEQLRERRVMFEIVQTDKGPRATNVRAVE